MSDLWAALSQATAYLYQLEGRWGKEPLALYSAGTFTLLLILRSLFDLRQMGFNWPAALLRSFFRSAWGFPLLYCLLLGVPLWLTLIFCLGFWVSAQLIIGCLTAGKSPRQKTGK